MDYTENSKTIFGVYIESSEDVVVTNYMKPCKH